jgi:hypothetical protein
MSTDTQLQSQDKWAFRFAFFDAHGGPNTTSFKEAIKDLPSKERMVIKNNFLGFFGPFYMISLGLWKKALVLLVTFVVAYVAIFAIGVGLQAQRIPSPILMFILFNVGFGFGPAINYAYYLKKVKNRDGWNPFEGLSWS